MKTRLLLILVLIVVAYAGYETYEGRDPLAHLTSLYYGSSVSSVQDIASTATTPIPAPTASAAVEPAKSTLVLSAPPRESLEDGVKRFGPMADYLSQVLGRRVTYKHPGTWGGYQTDLQRDAYDLVFDGPHFVGWRVEKYHHNVVVRLPGEFLYVGFVRKDNTRIQNIEQLAGQSVCVHAPPNLGTLMLLSEFDNPARQPSIVLTKGYENIFNGVLEGKCAAGMLPKKHLEKHDKDGAQTRIFYTHRPAPQQALTAGPRLTGGDRIKIAAALTSSEAEATLTGFRETYALSGWFVAAENKDYAGLGSYLKPVQGFYKQ